MSPTVQIIPVSHTLIRRRTNYDFPTYPPELQDYLLNFNNNVGLYLWYGLIGIILFVAIPHWAGIIQGFFRRREAGFRSDRKRLPRTRSRQAGEREDDEAVRWGQRGEGLHLGEGERKMSLRFGWYWLAAWWRKYSIKHSKVGSTALHGVLCTVTELIQYLGRQIAEFFFLGDLGQLFLIFIYLLLNFLLIFLGTNNDIDWMAHHVSRSPFSHITLTHTPPPVWLPIGS